MLCVCFTFESIKVLNEQFFFSIDSGGCEPCTTVQMQYDYAYQQQSMLFSLYNVRFWLWQMFVLVLEYDAEESKKIQIQAQPRSQFRPRTQNESRISSHYLRCEEGVKPEYPTIAVCHRWIYFQSSLDVNFYFRFLQVGIFIRI